MLLMLSTAPPGICCRHLQGQVPLRPRALLPLANKSSTQAVSLSRSLLRLLSVCFSGKMLFGYYFVH